MIYFEVCKWCGDFFVWLCDPDGVGGRGDVLMSAGNPSASSGITLRLLLRVSPLGTSLLCFIVYLSYIYSIFMVYLLYIIDRVKIGDFFNDEWVLVI